VQKIAAEAQDIDESLASMTAPIMLTGLNRNNWIGDPGTEAISESLRILTRIQTISLS
jgi:hypothetical protein